MKTTRTLTIVAVASMFALDTGGEANAQSTQTIRQNQFAAIDNSHDLVIRKVPQPVAGPNEVLVRVRATSLNRRDLYILNSDPGQRCYLVTQQ